MSMFSDPDTVANEFTYAGIGSRRTPRQVCLLITRLAEWLRARNYTLRSGGAEGADKAFEAGAGDAKEIYLPFTASPKALEIAEQYHPAWDKCSDSARQHLGRNTHIILGSDCQDPVSFVLCWTDSPSRGGTSQGLRIAADYEIPIYNLFDPSTYKRIVEKLS
jgi:hypothetical protein